MLANDDLQVFFGADFASQWTRLAAPDCAQVQFMGIHSVQDVDALQGYTVNADHELSFITADVPDLRPGHLLTVAGSTVQWRVRNTPRRQTDGATSLVDIGQITA